MSKRQREETSEYDFADDECIIVGGVDGVVLAETSEFFISSPITEQSISGRKLPSPAGNNLQKVDVVSKNKNHYPNGDYFRLEEGQVVSTKKRPTGQSSIQVQGKVAERIKEYVEQGQGIVFSEKISNFPKILDERGRFPLKEEGIDMCHGVSVKAMTEIFPAMTEIAPYQTPKEKLETQKAYENFVDAIASTDDDESRERGRRLGPKLQDPSKLDEAIDDCNQSLKRFSIDSRNLISGSASVNREIQASLDIHVIGFKNDSPVIPEKTTKIIEAHDKLRENLHLPPCVPKRGNDGSIRTSTAGDIPHNCSFSVLPAASTSSPSSMSSSFTLSSHPNNIFSEKNKSKGKDSILPTGITQSPCSGLNSSTGNK